MAAGNWRPPFSIVIAVDALGALFVLTTTLVGLIGLGYARSEMAGDGVGQGFFSFYLLLIAGVNGAFSTGDIFNLYVWFEVFLISSFGLIVFGGRPIQIDGAVKYGVLNLIATTIFLVAVGAVYGVTGTLNMADIRNVLATTDDGPVNTLAALFTLAFAMKAAAFPLHMWLPASYHTPQVIVSALFGGLLTKVGVYALMRVMVMLFGDVAGPFLTILGWVGVATAIIGAFVAIAQDGLRRMGAFLVVSGVGIILIGIGLNSTEAMVGAIVYTVHSILVMTGLFLALGLSERAGGGTTLSDAGGVYADRWIAAAVFLMVALSISGLPPFSGFWPKFMLVQAALTEPGALAVAAAVGVIVSGFLTTIALGRTWALAYLRPRQQNSAPDGEVRPLIAPVLTLAILTLAFGLFPSFVIEPAVAAAEGLFDPSAYVDTVLERGR